MRPTLSLCFLLPVLWLMPARAFAAKKDQAPADARPVLVSKDGGKPRWTTVEQLKQFAAKGDPQACFELADRYSTGDGVPTNINQAATLFEQAAKGGVASGWFRLGKIYHDGLTGAPDYGRALDYFTTAARAGVAEAQHNIGAMLVSARGVKRDYVEGLAWLVVAGQSGAVSDAEAQVRTRLAKRPADIQAAEARARELAANLANATVRAVRPGVPVASVIDEPKKLPPPPVITSPVEKPAVTAPKIEPLVPPRIDVPLIPPAPDKSGSATETAPAQPAR